MSADPLASMRCWAVDVEIGQEVLTIPPLPAADWWPLLAEEASLDAFLDILPADRRHHIEDRLIEDPKLGEELASAFLEALEQVCGRPASIAQVIAGVAIGSWEFAGGRMALAGFRWDVMPLAAALDALHAIFLEHFTEEGRKKYEALLKQATPQQLDRDRALSDFEASAGPRPAPAPLRSSAGPSADSPPRTRQPSRPPRRRDRSGVPTPPPGPPDGSGPPARNGTPPA